MLIAKFEEVNPPFIRGEGGGRLNYVVYLLIFGLQNIDLWQNANHFKGTG